MTPFLLLFSTTTIISKLRLEVRKLNQKNSPINNTPNPAAGEKARKAAETESNVLAYLHDLVWLLAVILLVFLFLFRIVIVSGPSMRSTLLNGDYLLLVGNLFYKEPQQGDIIVASKDSFRDGEPIVKRVIATEGQKVDIDFEQGIVYVDGEALDEPYTFTPTNLREGLSFPITVEENCVFVMGDNRNDSRDSRSSEIGQIDCREILGKAVFIIWPGTHYNSLPRDFSRIGVLS